MEITPFLSNNTASDEIMFVPNLRLSTEIVARTAITVTYQQGSPQPSVSIQTTSLEEIEENIAATSSGGRGSKGIWYEVNGLQGAELPALFERCIKALRRPGPVDVVIRTDINVEEKISLFKNHWRYQDYTTRYKVTPEEWETIFMAIRSAKPI
jgi:hypothetical protein